MSEDELEQIRKRKELELRQRIAIQKQREDEQQQLEAKKNAILRQILDPDARVRLTNIKMVKPSFAAQLELQLIQLAQTNQLQRMGIQLPMSDANFKMILQKISNIEKKDKFKIRRV
ncbi:MAG: DNA-binding protein [Candidatus Helarchaeota archaeon]